jgi:Xaa-Pro aminopeptidase
VPAEPNPVDAIWSDRPAPPLGRRDAARPALRRRAAAAKLARIVARRSPKLRADALVVSDPHAVAWTFNIRGADVAHTPLPLAFALIPREGRPALFLDGAS